MHEAAVSANTVSGDFMNSSRDALISIFSTTQMMTAGIEHALGRRLDSGFRAALNEQLAELEAIGMQAHFLATQRGLELPEYPCGRRLLSFLKYKIALRFSSADSHTAGLLIRRYLDARAAGLTVLNRWQDGKSQIFVLCQRLLDCETAAIRQLQQFL